jgi:diguanylate cyclase (GGDEF)-like protein/PAS domain S-box-containing protein
MSFYPDPASDIEAETQRQKTALLYRNVGIAQLVNVVNASLLAYVNVTMHASASVAYVWWCLVCAITAGRYLLSRRFHATNPDAAAAMTWRQRYLVSTAVAAVIWGAGAVFFMWNAPDGVRLFTGLVLAGMVAGAVPILAPVPAAFRIFTFLVLVPVSVVILLQADSALDWAFGATTIVFLAAVLASARYLHQTLDVAIRLGLEQSRLVENLSLARDAAEAALAERKQAEVTLQASEERYRLILQYSPTGILHYSNDLIITYCNDRLAQILQAPMERLIGLDMKILKDQRILPALRAAIDGKEGAYEGEYIATLSGAQIWVAMSCSPLHGTHGHLEGGIAIVADVSEQKRSEEEIRHLAYFDPLTHLPNRRLLNERLEKALLSGARHRRYAALLFIDLDNFKMLNDSMGHAIGDLLLRDVAQRLSASVRANDTVARQGGDEFVILLEELSQDIHGAIAQIKLIAQNMLEALDKPYQFGDVSYHCTASIGAIPFMDAGETVESLLKSADMAMYKAKAAGKNALRFFDPSMQTEIERRASVERELRNALQAGQFELYFQPQVDSAGKVFGAEALIRWQHPSRGLVGPDEFIRIAEESRLILPIGQWVLAEACRQLALWQKNPDTAHLTLAVNVSALQFRDNDFVNSVARAIAESGAPGSHLKLEITESLLLEDIGSTIEHMRPLKEKLGVGLVLDDFGTGYSSLSYLKQLPLDQIKIDRSFVRDINSNPNDAAIAETIIALGHFFNLTIIAEGVETAAQRDTLITCGCKAFQGFYFGKPGTIEQFQASLGSNS